MESRAVARRCGRPRSFGDLEHPIWGGPGWKVFPDHPDDIRRTIRYICGNPMEPSEHPFLTLALDKDLVQHWPMYALAAATLIYLTVIRPMRAKKKDPLDKPIPGVGLAQQRAVERDMSNLLVELSEMARQVTGQLDTRAKKLEVLIEEADRRIAELRSLSGAGGPNGGGGGKGADAPKSLGIPTGSRAGTPDPRHAEVYALADAGRSAADIAQALNRPRGEVELILALRPR